MIKKTVKKILGINDNFIRSECKEDNYSIALRELIKNDQSLVSKRATAGRRPDGKEFYYDVKKISEAFNFFNNDVFEFSDDKIPNIGEYDNLHSGTPMRVKPYKDCLKALNYLKFDKSLYCYPATVGGMRDRQAFVDYLIREGFNYKSNDNYDGIGIDNIVYTCSTTQAFSLILKLLVRPEDVVIVTGPNYGLFALEPERCNARIKVLNLEESEGFLVNGDKLAKLIDDTNKELKEEFEGKLSYIPKVAAFLNMNPHNPLGTVMSSKDIELVSSIGDTCLDRGVFVIDDLIYRDLCFDRGNLALPMASIEKYFNNTISLFGLSKAFGLASFRTGVIVAPTPIAKGLANLIFQEMDSTPVLQVKTLSAAFNGKDSRYRKVERYFDPVLEEYKYRYNLLISLVDGIDNIKDNKYKNRILKDINKYYSKEEADELIKGIPNVSIRKGVDPISGFFTVVDFTELKGKGKENKINTEFDLLKYFYVKTKLRYIMGVSMSWPYEDEMVGRVSFSLEVNSIISNFYKMNKAVRELLDE